MRQITRIAGLLLLSVALTTTAHAQRLFVLVAGDTTDAKTRDGIQQNMEWIQTTFRANVPPDQLIVRFLQGDKLTRKTLLDSITQCPVGAHDTFVVWWLGRGTFEDKQRFLLLPSGEKIARTAIRDNLVARPARLAVMILDTYGRSLPSAKLPEKTMEPVPADTLSPVFRSLFFAPRGLIAIDSAEPDQQPLLTTTAGGLMTCGLLLPPGVLGDVDEDAGCVTLNTPAGERELVLERGILWRDLSESVEWDTILAQLRSVTSANYRRAAGSQHIGTRQTPSYRDTNLKYADHFVQWYPEFNEFRARPRESRVAVENGRDVTYRGERKIDTEELNYSPPQEATTNTPDTLPPNPSRQGDTQSVLNSNDFAVIPGDHLIAINGKPIRNSREFDDAMRHLPAAPKDVQFTTVDNQTGERIHYRTRMDRGHDLGIKPWYWKDSLVLVHDVRPDSPADRAHVMRTEKVDLPDSVGLGIRGNLVEFDCPLMGGQKLIGIKVASLTEPERSDVKAGDIVFLIDGYSFSDVQGYHFALRNARQMAGVWVMNRRTGKVEHRCVFLPHAPLQKDQDPPPGVQYISISPANPETSPIW